MNEKGQVCENRAGGAEDENYGKGGSISISKPPIDKLDKTGRIISAQTCLYLKPKSPKMTLNQTLPLDILESIRRALAEDIGSGDVTTQSIVPAEAGMRGQIIAKQEGVVAGLDIAQAVYQAVDAQVDFEARVEEGARVENRQVLALVSGRTRSLLTAERTALNFLGRMSGIATLTQPIRGGGRRDQSGDPRYAQDRPGPACAG